MKKFFSLWHNVCANWLIIVRGIAADAPYIGLSGALFKHLFPLLTKKTFY